MDPSQGGYHTTTVQLEPTSDVRLDSDRARTVFIRCAPSVPDLPGHTVQISI
jgi:hypothetical protein